MTHSCVEVILDHELIPHSLLMSMPIHITTILIKKKLYSDGKSPTPPHAPTPLNNVRQSQSPKSQLINGPARLKPEDTKIGTAAFGFPQISPNLPRAHAASIKHHPSHAPATIRKPAKDQEHTPPPPPPTPIKQVIKSHHMHSELSNCL